MHHPTVHISIIKTMSGRCKKWCATSTDVRSRRIFASVFGSHFKLHFKDRFLIIFCCMTEIVNVVCYKVILRSARARNQPGKSGCSQLPFALLHMRPPKVAIGCTFCSAPDLFSAVGNG